MTAAAEDGSRERWHRAGAQGNGAAAAVRAALGQFVELTGQQPERVTGLKQTDAGWSVLVDITELERVPATSSVVATYRVDIDVLGDMVGYERLRRFVRGATD